MKQNTSTFFIYATFLFLIVSTTTSAQCGWQDVGPSEWTQPEFGDGSYFYDAVGIDSSNVPYIINGQADDHLVSKKNINGNWLTFSDLLFPVLYPYEYLKLVAGPARVPYLVFSSNRKLKVLRNTSSGWESICMPGAEAPNVVYANLAFKNTTPYAVVTSSLNNKISVKKFDGYNWLPVGPDTFSQVAREPGICFTPSGIPWVTYENWGGIDSISVAMYNGTDWSTAWKLGGGQKPKIVMGSDGFPIVSYMKYPLDPADPVVIKKFDGTNWNVVGGPVCSVTNFQGYDFTIDSLQRPLVIIGDYISSIDKEIKIFEYNTGSWNQLGTTMQGTAKVQITVDATDAPVISYASQLLVSNVEIKRFDGSNWVSYHQKGLASPSGTFSLKADTANTLYCAYLDEINGERLSVKKLTGSTWSTVGVEGFTASSGEFPQLAFDTLNTPYVGFTDYSTSPSKVSMMKFNGTTWVYVGTPGISVNTSSAPSVGVDSLQQPYVCYSEQAPGVKTYVQYFDGTNWNVLGGTYVCTQGPAFPQMGISKSGLVNVAITQPVATHSNLVVRQFDGATWQNLGATIALSVMPEYALAIYKDTVFVAYEDLDAGKQLVVKKFDGTSWVVVGSNLGALTIVGAEYPTMKIDSDGTIYIVYGEYLAGSNNVIKYNGSSWVRVGMHNYSRHSNNDITPMAILKDHSIYVGNNFSHQEFIKKLGNIIPSFQDPLSTLACENDTVGFSTNVIEPGIYFQWQENLGSGWNNLNDDSLHFNTHSPMLHVWCRPLVNNSNYRCIFTDDCATALDTTNAANLQLNASPSTPIISSLGPTSFCTGGNDTLAFIPAPSQTEHWNFQNVPVSGAADSLFIAAASGNYSLTAESIIGCRSTSASTLIHIVPDHVILISQGDSVSICSGSSMQLSTHGVPGLSYQWQSGGINIPGMTDSVISVNSAGTFNVISQDTIGCTDTSAFVSTYVFPVPNAAFSNSGSAYFCAGDSAILTANVFPGETYLWLNNGTASGITDTTFSVFTTDTVSLTAMNIYGCADTSSASIIILQLDCDTWPGDANNDTIVDNNDLLSIGMYYGQTGSARASISNAWSAWPSTDWGISQPNTQDIKHADCNGDGVIDNNDTLAVNLNFSLTHAFVPAVSDVRSALPDIYFITGSSSYLPGDFVDAELWLGTSATPVNNLYGIAFNISYDAALVQSGTESLTYPNSWLGTPGTNAIKISKLDAPADLIYGAETKINHINANGYGKIADLKFQLKSTITSADSMHLNITYYNANDSIGNPVAFNVIPFAVTIPVGITELGNVGNISIYPNPYSGSTQIIYSLIKKSDVSIEIYNAVGQKLETLVNADQSAGEYKYAFSAKEKGYDPGIYFVKFTIDGKTSMKKIVEMK